jgi:hypothetical protein
MSDQSNDRFRRVPTNEKHLGGEVKKNREAM